VIESTEAIDLEPIGDRGFRGDVASSGAERGALAL